MQHYFPETAEIHVADIKPSAALRTKASFPVSGIWAGYQPFLKRLAARAWDFVIDDARTCGFIRSFRSGAFPPRCAAAAFSSVKIYAPRSATCGLPTRWAWICAIGAVFPELSRCICWQIPRHIRHEAPEIYQLTDTDQSITPVTDPMICPGSATHR